MVQTLTILKTSIPLASTRLMLATDSEEHIFLIGRDRLSVTEAGSSRHNKLPLLIPPLPWEPVWPSCKALGW